MKRGPRLVILGKQGAGKGTQGLRVAKHFNTQHLSTGQLFRDSAEVGVAAGLEAKAFMDRGELVPDDIVVAVVEERFSNPSEVEPGFVLDGFPRTANQADELDRILGEHHPLDVVVDLDVPTEMAIERLLGRGARTTPRSRSGGGSELYEQETEAAHRPVPQPRAAGPGQRGGRGGRGLPAAPGRDRRELRSGHRGRLLNSPGARAR